MANEEDLHGMHNEENPHYRSEWTIRATVSCVFMGAILLESVIVKVTEAPRYNPKKVYECEPVGFLGVVVEEIVLVEVLNLLLVTKSQTREHCPLDYK